MIDFANIKHTTAGLECYYLGQRISKGVILHRFAVVNSASEMICYYNESGKLIDYDPRTGRWVACSDGHQIVRPPRNVEVTRWLCFEYVNDFVKDPIVIHLWASEPSEDQIRNNQYFKVEKITRTIEVPE